MHSLSWGGYNVFRIFGEKTFSMGGAGGVTTRFLKSDPCVHLRGTFGHRTFLGVIIQISHANKLHSYSPYNSTCTQIVQHFCHPSFSSYRCPPCQCSSLLFTFLSHIVLFFTLHIAFLFLVVSSIFMANKEMRMMVNLGWFVDETGRTKMTTVTTVMTVKNSQYAI